MRPATWSRQQRAVAIFGLLVAIFVVRTFVAAPGLSLSFLAVFPIVLAAFALGRDAALLCAVLALVLSVITALISPATSVSTGAQIVGAIARGSIYIGLAVLVSALLRRETGLRRQLAEREREVRELDSLREALIAPDLPELEGLDVATSYTPADGVVAGDFFLVTRGPRGTALVVVGDVVGHGLAAARRAAFVRATIALFAEYTSDPMTILRLTNTAVTEREPGTEYVTVLCASFAADRRSVTWASAGHPRPWSLDGGEPLTGARHAPPLGVEPVLHGEAVTVALDPGAGLLLFTDGLPEARTASRIARHERFGEQAAKDALRRLHGASPEQIVAALRAAAISHADGTPADDLCLVAVRRTAPIAQSQAA
jgi:serine phosphatase RsbU (regulator of sigma subunit)